MVQKLKTDLCALVKSLGYNITDNGAYVEKFPWLMARLGAYQRIDVRDTRADAITIVIDIFSTYKGEKEILDIAENITNHIWELRNDNPAIMFVAQKDLKIMDDNKTGPVKKHAVLSYQFFLSTTLGEEDANGSSGN